MKIYNKITMALAALTAMVGLASCSSSDDYEMAGKPDNAQVYFSSEMKTDFNLEEGQNSIDVEVRRVKTDGDLTVEVEAADESGIFNIPSSVKFDNGKDVANLTISFDFNAIKNNIDYPISLKLKNETTVYGSAATTVNVKFSPWTEWKPMGWKYPEGVTTYSEWEERFKEYGEGGYADTRIICSGDLPVFDYSVLGFGTYYQPVHYRESLEDPNQAQLLLHGWYNECDLLLNWDRTTNRFTAEKQWTGDTHPTYGQIYAMDSYHYWNDVAGQEAGYDYFPQGYDPDRGQITVNLAYIVSAGCLAYGPEVIQLPGYILEDYTLNITDEGSFNNEKNYGQVFLFTLGEDVASVRYAVFDNYLNQDEADQKAKAMVSGAINSTETKESGHKMVPVAREGKYTLIAVAFNADGESVGFYYINFECKAASGFTWRAINSGDYTYALFFGTPEENQVDKDLTLYVSNEDPTKFKIAPWAYSEDGFTFTMDADGNIVVDDQPTGFYDTQYGMVYVGDASTYSELGVTDKSFYEDGAYYFSLVYYVAAGYMGESIGYESFEVTGPAKQAAERAMLVARARAYGESNVKPREIKNVTKFTFASQRNHPYNRKINFNGFATLNK